MYSGTFSRSRQRVLRTIFAAIRRWRQMRRETLTTLAADSRAKPTTRPPHNAITGRSQIAFWKDRTPPYCAPSLPNIFDDGAAPATRWRPPQPLEFTGTRAQFLQRPSNLEGTVCRGQRCQSFRFSFIQIIPALWAARVRARGRLKHEKGLVPANPGFVQQLLPSRRLLADVAFQQE